MHLGFHQATVFQERNNHDLMKDFKDEVECFLNTRQVIQVLQGLETGNDPLENMDLVYKSFLKQELIGSEELVILDTWRKDFAEVVGR
jgi:hypothetical protein